MDAYELNLEAFDILLVGPYLAEVEHILVVVHRGVVDHNLDHTLLHVEDIVHNLVHNLDHEEDIDHIPGHIHGHVVDIDYILDYN